MRVRAGGGAQICKTQLPGLELPAQVSQFERLQKHQIEDVQVRTPPMPPKP